MILRSSLSLRLVILFSFSCLITLPTEAQLIPWAKRKLNAFLSDTIPADQPRFLAYPTLAYAPETSWEIGISSLYLYHANRDTINRLSEISAFTFITLERQYGIWLDHALYSDQDTWFLLGRLRWQSFPLSYYGIGPDTPSEYLAIVDAQALLLRERILRRIKGSYYLGFQFDWQRLSNVSFKWEEPAGELPTGSAGSSNLGLGLTLVHDDRHNVLNVRKGWFGEISYLDYGFGNLSEHSFRSFTLDGRYFMPVRQGQVLATQIFAQSVTGDVPFNQLALMGGESLMRGYYLGRYRDRNLLAAQVEYRWLPFQFSQRFGGALFVGAGQVASQMNNINLSGFKLAGGGGVRFLIFKKKDIYTRLDVAFTEEGNGFYLFIGEAF